MALKSDSFPTVTATPIISKNIPIKITSNNIRIAGIIDNPVIAVVDINENKIVNDYCFDLSLWSCFYLNQNLITCGTERGFVYLIDNRTESYKFQQQINGPPINSISKYNNNLILYLSAHEIKCFDIRMNNFIPIKTNIEKGGFSLNKANNSNIFTLLQRNQNQSNVTFCSFDDENFNSFKKIEKACQGF